MPKKVLPDEASFQAFERALVVKRGFRKITRTEFKKDFERLALEAPSPRKGREAGFAFTANGLTVIVWTTFVETEGAARETDAGWVLIKEKDNPLYFARPMNRTKNFLYRLLEQACIARERVLNRPLCPACNAFMRITQGRGLKSRYWSCKSPLHKKMERRSWDDGLRPEVLERVKKVRKSRAPYTDKLKAVGKASGIAMLRRKGWTVGKPGNMIP